MGAMPCHVCEIGKHDLGAHQTSGMSTAEYRTVDTYQDIIASNLDSDEEEAALKTKSLHPEGSALQGFYHPNIHKAFLADSLHMLDVGLCKDLWACIIRWIDGKPLKAVEGVDENADGIVDKPSLNFENEKADAAIFEEEEQIKASQKRVEKIKKTGRVTKGRGGKKTFPAAAAAPKKKVVRRKGRKYAKGYLEKLNTRARGIPNFPGWKSITKLSELTLITGHEMKLIIQVFDYLLDGLFDNEEKKEKEDPVLQAELILVLQLIMKFNEFYLAITATDIPESAINGIAQLGSELADLFLCSPLLQYSPTRFQTRKFHFIFNHAIDTIRMYGSLVTCNTSLWESYHRVIKRIARRCGNATLQQIATKYSIGQALNTTYVGLDQFNLKKKYIKNDDSFEPVFAGKNKSFVMFFI